MKKMFNFSKGDGLKLGLGAVAGLKGAQIVGSRLGAQNKLIRIGVPAILGLVLAGQKNAIIKGAGVGMIAAAGSEVLAGAGIAGFAANTPTGGAGVFGAPETPGSTL